MTSVNDLTRLNVPKPPEGFNPGLTWDGDTGHVTLIAPKGEQPSAEEVDRVLDSSPFLNSDDIGVDWSARPKVSIQHDSEGNLRTAWYKFGLVRKAQHSADVDELLGRIGNTLPPVTLDPAWRTIQISDTHIGKGVDAGAGTEQLIGQWQTSITRALDCGARAGINLMFLGDLIEGVASQGGMTVTQNDLTLTEQLRVARHMVAWTIDQALATGHEVVVSAIPGNHGDTSRQFARPHTDSYDIDIVVAVQEAFNRSEQAGRITWYYPEKTSHAVTYRAGDTTFTAAHGHLYKGKLAGAEKWWTGQIANNRPPAAAQILASGHFHGCTVQNMTRDRWIMFSPALERESTWFAEQTGATSVAGMLAYDTVGGTPSNITVY